MHAENVVTQNQWCRLRTEEPTGKEMDDLGEEQSVSMCAMQEEDSGVKFRSGNQWKQRAWWQLIQTSVHTIFLS